MEGRLRKHFRRSSNLKKSNAIVQTVKSYSFHQKNPQHPPASIPLPIHKAYKLTIL